MKILLQCTVSYPLISEGHLSRFFLLFYRTIFSVEYVGGLQCEIFIIIISECLGFFWPRIKSSSSGLACSVGFGLSEWPLMGLQIGLSPKCSSWKTRDILKKKKSRISVLVRPNRSKQNNQQMPYPDYQRSFFLSVVQIHLSVKSPLHHLSVCPNSLSFLPKQVLKIFCRTECEKNPNAWTHSKEEKRS